MSTICDFIVDELIIGDKTNVNAEYNGKLKLSLANIIKEYPVELLLNANRINYAVDFLVISVGDIPIDPELEGVPPIIFHDFKFSMPLFGSPRSTMKPDNNHVNFIYRHITYTTFRHNGKPSIHSEYDNEHPSMAQGGTMCTGTAGNQLHNFCGMGRIDLAIKTHIHMLSNYNPEEARIRLSSFYSNPDHRRIIDDYYDDEDYLNPYYQDEGE